MAGDDADDGAVASLSGAPLAALTGVSVEACMIDPSAYVVALPDTCQCYDPRMLAAFHQYSP